MAKVDYGHVSRHRRSVYALVSRRTPRNLSHGGVYILGRLCRDNPNGLRSRSLAIAEGEVAAETCYAQRLSETMHKMRKRNPHSFRSMSLLRNKAINNPTPIFSNILWYRHSLSHPSFGVNSLKSMCTPTIGISTRLKLKALTT